jgi:hypothetical protein
VRKAIEEHPNHPDLKYNGQHLRWEAGTASTPRATIDQLLAIITKHLFVHRVRLSLNKM